MSKLALLRGVAMSGVRQFEEEVVLDQALEVFWRKGLRATSMLDLTRATGVQRGSLYHAYGGKEALFRLAFRRYESRFLAAAASALDQPDARTALRRFFSVVVANMTAGAPSRGCLTTTRQSKRPRPDRRFAATFASSWTNCTKSWPPPFRGLRCERISS